MNDLLPIIIIGALLLFVIYTVMKNQTPVVTNPDNRDYRQGGNERPRYDDPEIRGQGSFGRDKSPYENDRDDNRAVPVWMEKERQRDLEAQQSQRSTYNDDPDIQGRGSFGRNKR